MFPRLLLLFTVVPVVELYLLFKIGAQIGLWTTLAIIVATAFIGATLTRLQGAATLIKAQAAAREGRVPTAEILDGIMILIAGAVLLTPGFLTDAFGFALLFPPVRSAVRKRLAKVFRDNVRVVGGTSHTSSKNKPKGRGKDDDNVIEAEVIDGDL